MNVVGQVIQFCSAYLLSISWVLGGAVLYLPTETCLTLCNLIDYSPPGSSVHEDPPGKNTGVGCYALLQGIFSIQGLNPGFLHCRWILYCLSHQGNPRILEWVAYPLSGRSSQPRDQTGDSCIAGHQGSPYTLYHDP